MLLSFWCENVVLLRNIRLCMGRSVLGKKICFGTLILSRELPKAEFVAPTLSGYSVSLIYSVDAPTTHLTHGSILITGSRRFQKFGPEKSMLKGVT